MEEEKEEQMAAKGLRVRKAVWSMGREAGRCFVGFSNQEAKRTHGCVWSRPDARTSPTGLVTQLRGLPPVSQVSSWVHLYTHTLASSCLPAVTPSQVSLPCSQSPCPGTQHACGSQVLTAQVPHLLSYPHPTVYPPGCSDTLQGCCCSGAGLLPTCVTLAR